MNPLTDVAAGATVSELRLPEAPERAPGTVVAWREPIVIDTYLPDEPSRYPAFFRKRVYQGSSGRVYPLPFHERIAPDKAPHEWDAVHLENDWMRLVILPELGGRIHVAFDKIAGYDIFYRNAVIKPALVGLAGPWISGGVEFNWPQHHRPATFLPTDVEIEHEPDGAIVVWCSDHDPFARMKGMHGVRLRPGSSRIELDVRLYNRNDAPQTFLWWANVAAAVNDDYQSFFPPDVRWVADHAKRATVTFPAPTTPYYGIDYAARKASVGGDADRIDWYRNIPVPTSYMAISSAQEFFGGYDHGRQAGFVHWAPHEVSPGKKQWTWGNDPFGHAWDANLTDTDGPYIELMAGVFTDNQPDFAYLAPGETKTFRQVWYPIREIGPAHGASSLLAAGVGVDGDGLRLGMIASERIPGLRGRVFDPNGVLVDEFRADLDVNEPVTRRVPAGIARVDLSAADRLLVSIDVTAALALDDPDSATVEPGEPAREPEAPADIATIDELVHVATYLGQYRHATRSPRPYWDEVLRRDPGESRAHLALAWDRYNRADYATALAHAEASVSRRTEWTPTPRSGEAHYVAGLAAERLGMLPLAVARWERAAWDAAHATAASTHLARLKLRAGDASGAVRVLDAVVRADPSHLRAADLRVLALRRLGDHTAAAEQLARTLARDPLDAWARHLSGAGDVTGDATIALDVALEYAAAGEADAALQMLALAERLAQRAPSSQVDIVPLVIAHRAALLDALGHPEQADAERRRLDGHGHDRALPARLDDVDALRAAASAPGSSAVALALLASWEYHSLNERSAIELWQRALAEGIAPAAAAIALRNLAVAEVNAGGDPRRALERYTTALELAPGDAKLVFEQDQLRARLGQAAVERLLTLDAHPGALDQRDDLVISRVHLLVEAGEPDIAFEVLAARRFQPWEGGEGQAVGAWERTCDALARRALRDGDIALARRYADAAQHLPASLGEQRHPLANEARLQLLLGDVAAAEGRQEQAEWHWRRAAASLSDFTSMAVTPYSIQSLASVGALLRLEQVDEARSVIEDIRRWLQDRERTPASIDYFATSLPTMLLFDVDPAEERRAEAAAIAAGLDELERTMP